MVLLKSADTRIGDISELQCHITFARFMEMKINVRSK